MATTTAQNTWETSGGDDFLQLKSKGGGVLASIDSEGKPQGNLLTPAPISTDGVTVLGDGTSSNPLNAVVVTDGITVLGNGTNAQPLNARAIISADQQGVVQFGGGDILRITLPNGAQFQVVDATAGGFLINSLISSVAANMELGFFGATPVTKPAVTGSKGGNAALASLITALVALGLITDSTT